MDRGNELLMCERVAALGVSVDAAVLGELAGMTGAESAIGRLAGIVPADDAVGVLLPMLRDRHPQCRQYAAKALGAFGAAADKALPDLRDLYRNPAEKDYVKRTVLTAGKTIREALRLAAAHAVRLCGRCGVQVSPEEYARSQQAFQRVFCGTCFDEVYLERRNFDTKVELNKTIQARDGTLVQSDGERLIAEWLTRNGIVYRYDERMRIIEGYAIRPDFYSISREDKPNLQNVLREKLNRYVRMDHPSG